MELLASGKTKHNPVKGQTQKGKSVPELRFYPHPDLKTGNILPKGEALDCSELEGLHKNRLIILDNQAV